MVEEELRYIDFGGKRYTVPEKAVTIDGSLNFEDNNSDGNVTITITEENDNG